MSRHRFARFAGKVCAILGLALVSATALADTVLEVDLSVPDQITIAATDGLSAESVIGSDFMGFYLEGLFGSPGDLAMTHTSGDLTSASNTSDGDVSLLRPTATDPGLNVFYTATGSNLEFIAGSIAFSGSATWVLDHAAYMDMVQGANSGDVYFPADGAEDAATAALLGTYTVVAKPVLVVDLTVANQITISAANAPSAATISGSDTMGFYLGNFFNSSGSVLGAGSSGDLTSAANTSNGNPGLFRSGQTDPGLNVYATAKGEVLEFTTGSVAFSGSATWTLDHAEYLDLLVGTNRGNVYFPADSADDVTAASLLGTYAVVAKPTLFVDLTVMDQITITATNKSSAATISGSDSIGFYLEGLFGGPGNLPLTFASGDLTSANNTSNDLPLFYRYMDTDPGLNVHHTTADPSVQFTTGRTAFSGTATQTLDHVTYVSLLHGAASGSVYFPADSADDIESASILGAYKVLRPADSIFADGFEDSGP